MTPFKQNSKIFTNLLFSKRPFIAFLAHWVAWLILHFIVYLPSFLNNTPIIPDIFIFNHIILVTFSFLLFYIVAFFIMPRLGVDAKKWEWMVVTSLLLAIAFTFFKFRLEMFRTEYMLQKNSQLDPYPNNRTLEPIGFFSNRFRSYFQTNILINVSIVILAFTYRLSVNWYQQEKARKELENQRLRAELSYLKMQVNPHFLFNALNNIYSLAVIEKSKRTGDSIMKLSELMRYVLYEKEDEEHKVKLENEISYINSYIDLEKLRHEGVLYLNFSIEGDTSKKRIPPLLLFPLIENAFKHGLLSVAEKPVTIELKITETLLNFSILNYKNNYMKDQVGGIGLPNVRKRLDLLYDNLYVLNVLETKDQFFVNLQLPL